MIFGIDGHVELIIKEQKTETRRQSDKYKVGRTYPIQRCRTCKGIKEGRILILRKKAELCNQGIISIESALAEGNYTPEKYESLYRKMYSNWKVRWAYKFRFIGSKEPTK